VANYGYWGIPINNNEEYVLSLYAKCSTVPGNLDVALENASGKQYARQKMTGITGEWMQYSCILRPNSTDPAARLVISSSDSGTIWLDVVSLFPKATFKNRQNGLRKDLVEMLDGLRPAFVRFPGGCWVEGESLKFSYRWKQTIGNIAERVEKYNLWKYHSTNGLGYHEYLQLCEDLGAKALFVVNCGMSHTEIVPMAEMGPWVQDALDAVEYARGSMDTQWGALRARNGHPAPFDLTYMEIGNENGGSEYDERYALFYDALKAKYPDLHLIADVWGGVPKSRPVEIVDQHYYSSPKFFENNTNRYDTTDRKSGKIYVGEYAVTEGKGAGNLRGALGEAAFMTGMERNSDVVIMSSYAPLFANVNKKAWNPDLINFDGTRVYGTPSYYVQKMFAENQGDVTLPVQLNVANDAIEQPAVPHGAIGLGTWETQSEYKNVRVAKNGKVIYESDFNNRFNEWASIHGEWKVSGGALQQLVQGGDMRIVAGDTSWQDYTYTLEARKLSGDEGFLILFDVKDTDNWLWWNIGGWGNTRHGIELCDEGGKSIIGKRVEGSVTTGKWYRIKIEVNKTSVRCYLDDQLIHDVNLLQQPVKPLYVSASRNSVAGEIILKVVNVTRNEVVAGINLKGTWTPQIKGEAVTLSSSDPSDENTLEFPKRVFPMVKSLDKITANFQYKFPSYSLTILKLFREK
jgi:alpha-L-arabinofuranosidase